MFNKVEIKKKKKKKKFKLDCHPPGPSYLRARTHWANFCLFCEKICHHFHDTSAHGDFFSHQICQALPNFKGAVILEQDKFLSGVKTIHILQFTGYDLKKKSF